MRKVLKVITTLVLLFILLIGVCTVFHQGMLLAERSKLERLGNEVTVNGKKMNVFTAGEGEHTIVLMPGLGTTAPVLDFEPLIEELASAYHVVVVEPFGYGWSDLTSEPRTVENMIEEMRAALMEAGETGPYILMPHSVSGIYATWYANKYPSEIEGIVGIDCSLPKQTAYFGGTNPHVAAIAKLVNPIGLQRILCAVSPTSFISDNQNGIYSEKNLYEQKLLSNQKGYNAAVINETNAIEENIDATIDMDFDRALPLLFFTREVNGTAQEPTKKDFYESYITNPAIQEVVVLDAGHYMHWTKSQELAQAVMEFVATRYE